MILRNNSEIRILEIRTPENVTLFFRIADKSVRATAFYIDLLIISLAYLIPLIILYFINIPIIILKNFYLYDLVFFVGHLAYFVYFEIQWQGSTPGKRIFKLRVINKMKLPLTVESLIIRNVLRTIEFFIPYLIFWKIMIDQEIDLSVTTFISLIWLLLFMSFPLFNKNGLRLGDFIAGTMVIELPKQNLLPDLIESRDGGLSMLPKQHQLVTKEQVKQEAEVPKTKKYHFTAEQLNYYGKFELQTLEEILRKETSANTEEIKAAVAERIRKRLESLGWSGNVTDYQEFLAAFYEAQRANLELKLAFGRKKESKDQ